MKPLIILAVLLPIFLLCDTADGDSDKKAARKAERARLSHIYKSRPRRLDVPLRVENISDEEVREIQAVTVKIYPGAIANISGVTEGCPCEEGPLCTSQVWVVAYRDSQYNGLMLSKVGDTWTVGLIQRWWLKYDELRSRLRAALSSQAPDRRDVYRKLFEKQYQFQETLPVCAPQD